MDAEISRAELLDSLQELSEILETGLDRETLSILLELTESLIKELRKQNVEKDNDETPVFFN